MRYYELKKYVYANSHVEIVDCGCVSKKALDGILTGMEYDERYEMWFSKNAEYAYDAKVVSAV